MIKKNIASLILMGVFTVGCATNVGVGQRVFITPSDSSHLTNCKMLGQVEVDAAIFWKFGVNEQIAEIKNRLRDQTAARYPSADTVSHSSLNAGTWNGPEANVMGTAFKCFD
tara:strand:+ start:1155 stop:1490 length:336 start_codon:yes stop_codon:yes gene_type:complete